MKGRIITILMLCIYMISNAQNTWSKEYDLGEGRDNFLESILIQENKIYAASEQFCPTDTSIHYYQCGTISVFDFNGELIKNKTFKFTSIPDNRSILNKEGRLFFFTEPYMGQNANLERICKLSENFVCEDSILLKFLDNEFNVPSGISLIDGNIYSYGTLVNKINNQSQAFFAKLDDSLNVEIINRYPARQLNVFMNDLQPTPDGNLAFILKQKGPAGPTSNPGFEIYKVNYEGTVLDSFVFNEGFGLDWPFNLTIDDEGNYYFYSDKHPVEGFPPSIGRMNKLSKDMKTLEWSVILPNSTFGRQYRIEESLLARNGDIIICGSMQDFLTFENSPDHVHTGFITRFDQEGNIVWHHIYKVPNDEYLPQSEYGRYRFSRLTKIVEMEDGSLLAGGNHAYHWTVYDHPDFDDTKETNLLWLLKVDDDGCLEGEECDEVIEIGRGIKTNPIFTIGTKWTYDYSPVVVGGPFGQDSLLAGYIEFEIVDTFRRNDSLFYSFGDEKNGYMYQDGEKIYLDVPYVGLQLTYDFNNDEKYSSKFLNPRTNRIDTAIVNVKLNQSLFDFGDRGLQSIQNLSIDNNGTYEDMPLNADILYHCGKMYGGLPLGLGLGLSDPPYIIGKLRCFEQGDFSFNFTGSEGDSLYVSCDSVRYISATIDEEITKVSISPNPFTYQLNISIDNPRPLTGNILNIHGRILKSFDLNNRKNLTIDLESLPASMYIVDIKNEYGKQMYREKIIKIN